MDRDDLKQLLGPFQVRCPLDAVLLETADCGLYVRETIEYAVEADERVKSFLLVPKHINRTAPAIFAHHQHASQFHLGKSEVVGLKGDADQAYASELAERGYVVIAPDALAFEERNWSNPSGYAEYYELATRLVQGRTLLSKCLHDVSVALDYLVARPEVDPLRVGFIGHSYGGKMAIWAPALDNRIRASVSNCGCVSYKQSLIRDLACKWNFAYRAYSNLGMLKISFGLLPLARYFCKRLQKMYGLGEPPRYLNMLNQHFQKESSSFDVGQVVMSSRKKCDKRHIVFLTSISRERITQTTCSFALQFLRQELLHCIPRKTRHVRRLLRCTPFFRDGSRTAVPIT